MAACTTHFALAMLVSAAAHEAKSAAPKVGRDAALSMPSRGVAGSSGAELVACKRSCSPHLSPHLSSNEGNFPFEKSKTGLGEALVAGLSASRQCTLAPLRHLWWDVAAAWYCRESHLRRYRGLLRMQEASACGRWRGPTAAQSDRLLLSSLAIELRQSVTNDARRVRASLSAVPPRPRHRTRCETRARARSVAPEPRERSSSTDSRAAAAPPPRRRRAATRYQRHERPVAPERARSQ